LTNARTLEDIKRLVETSIAKQSPSSTNIEAAQVERLEIAYDDGGIPHASAMGVSRLR
jgi:hypothetical protein